jgi:hypothetical protein
MEILQNMVGKYWTHSPASKKLMSDKAKARWASMSPKKRAVVGKKISKAKTGAASTMTKEARQARAEKIRAHWAAMTPKERAARIRKAVKAKKRKIEKR